MPFQGAIPCIAGFWDTPVLGVSVVQGPKQAIWHTKADGSWKVKIEPTSKIRLELLTAFLPVENVHDDGDVVAPKSMSISGQAYLLFVVVIEGSCVGRGVGGVPSSKPIARANVTW